MTSDSLRSALAELAEVAEDLDIDADTARNEGLHLAAALAEPAPGAFQDWASAQEIPADATAFFAAAAKGRRYRVVPTPTLASLSGANADSYRNALAKVIQASCLLGTPNAQVAENASAALMAQAGTAPTPGGAPTQSAVPAQSPPGSTSMPGTNPFELPPPGAGLRRPAQGDGGVLQGGQPDVLWGTCSDAGESGPSGSDAHPVLHPILSHLTRPAHRRCP